MHMIVKKNIFVFTDVGLIKQSSWKGHFGLQETVPGILNTI